MPKNSSSPFSLENALTILSENFLVVLLVLAAFVGGFFVGSMWTENQLLKAGTLPTVNQPAAGQPTAGAGTGEVAEPPIEKLPAITDQDHIDGSRDADVIVVEYSDMNCPYCRRFHPTMKQIREEFGDKVAWVYRHFPFQGQNSDDGAAVSECIAATKGNEAFWMYTNTLYELSEEAGSFNREIIIQAAAAAGVNESGVENCLADDSYMAIVTAQRDGGAAAGVTGTPASIIVTKDGPQEFVSGALPFETLKTTIEAYL